MERTDPRKEMAIAMRKEGMTIQLIAKSLQASTGTIYRWIGNMPRPLTVKRAMGKYSGYTLGKWSSMTDEAMMIVAKEIRGSETIIACMARLVASMSQEKEEP